MIRFLCFSHSLPIPQSLRCSCSPSHTATLPSKGIMIRSVSWFFHTNTTIVVLEMQSPSSKFSTKRWPGERKTVVLRVMPL